MDDPREQALAFLRSTGVMNIACIYDGRPISSTVAFSVDDKFNFYFATKDDTYKSKALDTNHMISWSVWRMNEFLFQADGGAIREESELKANELLETIVKQSLEHKQFWPPLLARESGDFVVYKIITQWARLTDMRELANTQHQMPTYKII